jgi:hypothetical protein
MNVRKIAASAAGYQDFFADALGALEKHNATSALPCFYRTHQPGSAGAEDDRVVSLDQHIHKGKIVITDEQQNCLAGVCRCWNCEGTLA